MSGSVSRDVRGAAGLPGDPAMTGPTAIANCLRPLLQALGWRGADRALLEARAGSPETMDALDLRTTLANLGFTSWAQRGRLDATDPRLYPCLFVGDDGAAFVVEAGDGAVFSGFDGRTGQAWSDRAGGRRGTAYFFAPIETAAEEAVENARGSWFWSMVRRFRPHLVQALALTFLLNILALAIPVFVKTVYDRVLAANSRETLLFLSVGVVLALLLDVFIRYLRSRVIAYVGGRIDMIVGSTAMERLLALPLIRLEQASVGAQVARLRQFEGVRNFFVGPLALALLELPFVLVFFAVIASFDWRMALVPLIIMGLFGAIGLLLIRLNRASFRAGQASAGEHQALVAEMLYAMRAIKTAGAETLWMERYRDRSAQLSTTQLASSRLSAGLQTLSQSVTMLSGAATLVAGSWLVMHGSGLTTGALIATMMLVWRIIAPVQTCFLAVTRLDEVGNAIHRIDQLAALPSERGLRSGAGATAHGRQFSGRIAFRDVILRYSADFNPALMGVSFTIEPGQLVALTGVSGCGKSSILKLIMRLYDIQAGAVLIDGIESRQIHPVELRRSIAYLPQSVQVFSGSIADNLRLVRPDAFDDELEEALARAGAIDAIEELPDGLDTQLGGGSSRLPVSLLQGICLARVYLQDAAILLLDEPANHLDTEATELLLEQLEMLRGRKVVVMVTHRPSHIRAADRVLLLREGRVVFFGEPAELFKQSTAQLS